MYKEIYKTLNQINNFLIQNTNKNKFFSNICSLLSKNKYLKFSLIYDDIDKIVITKNENFKNFIISNIFKKKNNFLKQLIFKTIKNNTSFVINNFKKDDTFSSIHSVAAFPIKKSNITIAVLKIYSSKKNFFDLEIKKLFDKLAINISCAFERLQFIDIKNEQKNDLEQLAYTFDFLYPIIVMDKKFNIIKANETFCKSFSYSKEDLIGNNLKNIDIFYKKKKLIKEIKSKLYLYEQWNGNIIKELAEDIIYFKIKISTIKNKHQKIKNYIAQFINNTDEINKEKILEYKATHDILTGLPNRLLLIDRIQQAIIKSSRYKYFSGLIFIDIDNFKMVNDTLGHYAGDILLINIAKKIKNIIRNEDTISRIGGDEFVILIENLGLEEYKAKKLMTLVANKIKNGLDSVEYNENNSNVVTLSIGATLFNSCNISPIDIINKADKAMYIAKKQGKNSIKFLK